MDRISKELPTYNMGYAIEEENRPLLEEQGIDPQFLLARAAENFPPFNVQNNPREIIPQINQGQQGSCQGHSLMRMFIICYYLMTGRILSFSRAAAYYLSQRKDGIKGDRGSTLSGGQWVATQHGLCLESEWKYPSEYDPREPNPKPNYDFKLVSAKPTNDPRLIREALDMGLPVQDGIKWTSEVSQSIVTNYSGRGGGGGHSTTLWLKNGENYIRDNSWGNWDGDGCNENTPRALDQQVEFGGNTHIIYAPEGMIYPELAPAKIPT